MHHNMNLTVNACSDFYEFVCGGWKKSNPIPNEHIEWSVRSELAEQILMQLRGTTLTSLTASFGFFNEKEN
jgi:predicted metalloendopeptidase